MTTPIAILASLTSLLALSDTSIKNENYQLKSSIYGSTTFAATKNSTNTINYVANSGDSRKKLVRDYLEFWKSPLLPYADLIVDVSDKYGLDFRLLPAIAQQESNLGKKEPPGSHNPFGWGINSKGTLKFDSYEEAIETVSKGISEEYITKGYTTIENIMKKYTPNSNGSWAYGVQKFMSEIE